MEKNEYSNDEMEMKLAVLHSNIDDSMKIKILDALAKKPEVYIPPTYTRPDANTGGYVPWSVYTSSYEKITPKTTLLECPQCKNKIN